MKKLSAILFASVFVLFISAGGATASAILELSSNLDTVTIPDGDGDGFITFNGGIGDFNINVTTVLTKPLIGSADWPYLDLNSIDVSSGSGTLTIKWTDTDFTNAAGISAFESLIGGTTDGTVSFQAYLDSSNTAFGMATQLSDLGPFTNKAFSDGSIWSGMFSEPYSLTLVAIITHDAGGDVTSFDAKLSAVPIPTTLFLFGSGLFGLIGIRRKVHQV